MNDDDLLSRLPPEERARVKIDRLLTATLKRYEWECPDSGATVTPTRVLRVLSEAEYGNLSQEDFDLLVSSRAAG